MRKRSFASLNTLVPYIFTHLPLLLRMVPGLHSIRHRPVVKFNSFPGGHSFRVFFEELLKTSWSKNNFAIFTFLHFPVVLRKWFGGHTFLHRFVSGFISLPGGHCFKISCIRAIVVFIISDSNDSFASFISPFEIVLSRRDKTPVSVRTLSYQSAYSSMECWARLLKLGLHIF